MLIPTSESLITSTGTGDSIFTLPVPRLPTKMTSCKSVVLALSVIFKLSVAFTVLVSKPNELMTSCSFSSAAIEKEPSFPVAVAVLVLATLMVTPSSAVPLASVTLPFTVYFCAKELRVKRVNKMTVKNECLVMIIMLLFGMNLLLFTLL